MAAEILVKSTDETRFEVVVREEGSETRHAVTVEPDYARKLAGTGTSAEELVHQSFQFLLEHESKESILRRFNLREISHYFPGYEAEIRRRLSR